MGTPRAVPTRRPGSPPVGGRHAVLFNKRTKLLGYPLLDDTGSLKLRPRAPAVVATSPADVASPLRDSLPCGGVKKTHKRGASATSTGRGQPPKDRVCLWVVCAVPVLAAWAQRRDRLVPAAPCGDPLGGDPRLLRRVDWFGGRRESTRGSRYSHHPPPRPPLLPPPSSSSLLPAALRPGLTGPTRADATRGGARTCATPAQA